MQNTAFLKRVIQYQVFDNMTVSKAFETATNRSRSKELPNFKTLYFKLKSPELVEYKAALIKAMAGYKKEIINTVNQ